MRIAIDAAHIDADEIEEIACARNRRLFLGAVIARSLGYRLPDRAPRIEGGAIYAVVMIGSVMRRPECMTTRSTFLSCAAAYCGPLKPAAISTNKQAIERRGLPKTRSMRCLLMSLCGQAISRNARHSCPCDCLSQNVSCRRRAGDQILFT